MAPRQALRTGETALARAFFAGHYAKVAAATFDRGSPFADRDVAFAVGALTFLGRIDDAHVCEGAFRRRVRDPDPRTLVFCRFFLGVAHARAGSFDRSYELLVRGCWQNLRSRDPWCQAIAFQGLACQRFFTGDYANAARHAFRAQRAAHAGDFAWGKLLATDLRGHALVQVGKLRAGLDLLAQAKLHAERLGLTLNAYAIACSIASITAKISAGTEGIDAIAALLAEGSHDSYSRHALLTALAAQLALRGRGSEARETLHKADALALKTDQRRAKLRSLVAHLHVARFGEGPARCAELLEAARELLDASDVAFRAELLAFEIYVARSLHDEARLSRAQGDLQGLARRHESYWARAALEQSGIDTAQRPRAFPEDTQAPLLRAVSQRDGGSLHRLLAAGLLGAIPELLGRPPSRRILVLPSEHALLLEDRGDVVVRTGAPRWCPALLRLLSRGDVPKEELVSALWGLRTYRPDRHDPLLRTTIHRLRAVLAPHGDWVRVTEHGYGTLVPVQFVRDDTVEGPDVDAETDLDLTLAEDEAPPAVPLAPPRMPPPDAGPSERLLAKLRVLGPCTVKTIARATGTSQSTALRALRAMVAKGQVSRSGFARATRYAVRAEERA